MEHGIMEIITHLVFQLAVILILARVGGEVCERWLKQPAVLGELIVGMIIGPYALGGYLKVPGLGALFPPPEAGVMTNIPVSTELYAFAQVAVVILLFMAGLETDLPSFFRYAFPATMVAVGGVVFPFLFGAYTTVLFGYDTSIFGGKALFMGAIMTATSVGITARILSDIKKLDTPEGVTIMGGAVVDDVLGILILAVVVSLTARGVGQKFSGGEVAVIAAKAIGVWLGIMAVGLIFRKKISRFMEWFKSAGAALVIALSLCYFAAAIAEMFGLAMIIGAYAIGLAISDTPIAKLLVERLHSVYYALVPIFFVIMGMLVDFRSFKGALGFGLVITVLAIIGKVFGCAFPALAVGFNMRGSSRIGIGMLPRGEVALIIAGVGLARNVLVGDVGKTIFGCAVLMTMVTTLMAPIILVPLFQRGGSGRKHHEEIAPEQSAPPTTPSGDKNV